MGVVILHLTFTLSPCPIMISLNLVPDNKQLLWFFDDEMTYDLIAIEYGLALPRFYCMVERATIYSYPFKEDYSLNLFNLLLPYSQAVKNCFPNPISLLQSGVTLVVPPHNSPIVLSYFIYSGERQILDKTVAIIDKNFKHLVSSTTEQTITISCLSHSLMVVSDDTDVVEVLETQINNTFNYPFGYNLILPPDSFKLETRVTYPSPPLSAIGISYSSTFKNPQAQNLGSWYRIHSIPYYTAKPEITITESSAKLAPCGALIYAYPLHKPLQHYQISDNYIIGNFILQDFNEQEIMRNYNIGQYNDWIEQYAPIRFMSYPRENNNSNRLAVYQQYRTLLIQDSLIDYYEATIATTPVPVKAVTNDYTRPYGDIAWQPPPLYMPVNGDELRTGHDPFLTDHTDNEEFWWELFMRNPNELDVEFLPDGSSFLFSRLDFNDLDSGNVLSRCTYFTYQKVMELLPAHWSRGADITPYLSPTWLINRVAYHSRNTILLQFFNGRANSVDISNPLLRALWDDFYRPPINDNLLIDVVNDIINNIFNGIFNISTYNDRPPFIGLLHENIIYESSILYFITKMNENILLQEIHACLGAGEASYYTDSQGNPQTVIMNIARKLDLLCKWQGLSVKLDGSYNRSQSSKYFPPGRPIPPGWYYDRTGVNGGFFEDSEMYKEVDSPLTIDDQRVGMAYQVRSNLGVETGEGLEIIKGGTVLCNNIVQYIDTMFDDLSKALDIEELGTGAITVGDKTFIYEGLLDILQEILFLVSDNNNNTEESKIAIGVTQQVTKEILKALGLPYGLSAFEYAIEGQGIEDIVDGKPLKRTSVSVPYPATLSGAPTLVDLLMAILANQGIQNISQISLKNSKLAELINQQSQ